MRLVKFYQKHNEEKLVDVEKELDLYEGDYASMFAELERKYEPTAKRPTRRGSRRLEL